ncbi:MAG: hypothetical protein ACP6IU_13435 [Candidatus Asgardarchaeia archaeon]
MKRIEYSSIARIIMTWIMLTSITLLSRSGYVIRIPRHQRSHIPKLAEIFVNKMTGVSYAAFTSDKY